ncbi:MAG: AbrB/MazE/SpoVT family DNA-binding domain-containing protein [Candidatus Woesearchaeota archaeon]|jgi:phosphate uptake regulator|nr:AbrB/MazE/SpoVT family DNA-binding domain-containing protein [Candidatus Woesearchaeota archaeon]MDP7457498.1 AbrB/MazE/SpoVT family DNA-binding domain-containing protein [Candidatus Woesearchaeota archaeon]
MRRKLVQHGGSTLVVSIPSKWAKKHELEKGQEISIEEKENSLIVTTAGEKGGKKKKEISIESFTYYSLRSIISGLYRTGYDEIKIHFEDKIPISMIHNIMDLLPGYEANFISENTCVITSIIKASDEMVDSMINKLFLNLKMMFDMALDMPKKVTLDDAYSMKNNCLRIRDYCHRMIRNINYGNENSYDYYTIVFTLEKISGLVLHSLLTYLINKKMKIKKEELDLINENKKMLEELYALYLNKKWKEAEAFYNKLRDHLLQVRKKGLQIKDGLDLTIKMHMESNFHYLFALSSRILNIAVAKGAEK